ncbi:MAG: hypothetical protein IKD70_06940, partial [Eggerthellaceae bacterium]|nr:hypothetical protein [Eggerthellaceae bacterium]
MLIEEFGLRSPLANSGKYDRGAALNFGRFSCKNVRLMSDDGASGLVYTAESPDYYGSATGASAKLIIKEFFPIELAPWLGREGDALVLVEDAGSIREAFEEAKARFLDSFDIHTARYQSAIKESVTVPIGVFEASGTLYIASDANNGVVLTEAVQGMSAFTQIKMLMHVCRVLESLHEDGYAYLDLKPSNILAVRAAGRLSGEAYTGEVRFFDFGTVASIEDLRAGRASVTASGDWSA